MTPPPPMPHSPASGLHSARTRLSFPSPRTVLVPSVEARGSRYARQRRQRAEGRRQKAEPPGPMPRAPCPMPSVPIHPFHRAPGCSRTPSRWTLNVPTASPASSGGAVAGCGSSTPPAPNASPATGGNPGTPATTGTARIPKARAPSSSTTTTRQAVPGSCRGGMTDERANGQTGRRVALPDLAPGPMPHALGPMPHAPEYVELHCHSVFSLLDGASEPEELVARAVALGMSALALTDHDDLGGAVRFA